jgi:hypothetical protein
MSTPLMALSYSDILRALVTATTPAPVTPDCPCGACGEHSEHLAPLKSDYTYECAVRDYSFERDDGLCPYCRTWFEKEHGLSADDVYHVYDRGHDRND